MIIRTGRSTRLYAEKLVGPLNRIGFTVVKATDAAMQMFMECLLRQCRIVVYVHIDENRPVVYRIAGLLQQVTPAVTFDEIGRIEKQLLTIRFAYPRITEIKDATEQLR